MAILLAIMLMLSVIAKKVNKHNLVDKTFGLIEEALTNKISSLLTLKIWRFSLPT